MCLSIKGYAQIVRMIKALADKCCEGRLVFSLEGGYNPAPLAGCVKAVFAVLLGDNEIEDRMGNNPSPKKSPDITQLLGQLRTSFELS